MVPNVCVANLTPNKFETNFLVFLKHDISMMLLHFNQPVYVPVVIINNTNMTGVESFEVTTPLAPFNVLIFGMVAGLRVISRT